MRIFLPTGRKLNASDGKTVFWQNLYKATMETQRVKSQPQPVQSQLDSSEELAEVEVQTLTLADNTGFMGKSKRSSTLVPPQYTELWKEVEPLIKQHLTGTESAAKRMPIRYVYTGTPGIGKSVASWYFMYELRRTAWRQD